MMRKRRKIRWRISALKSNIYVAESSSLGGEIVKIVEIVCAQ